jgi:thymidylate kinase
MATPLSAMAAAPQSQEPAGNRLSALAPPSQPGDQPVNPITQDYYGRLMNDYFGLVSQYQQLPESDQGRTLNTDVARELSPAYRADRTKSADVHEPSSEFVKRLYADKLAAPTPKGQEPTVIFTAGGTGAGKTTGMEIVKKINPKAAKAEIVYDTNMNKFESADKKIRQALKAGRRVNIIYTHRDPVEALENGALKRAMRMEEELGTGRTVPLSEHARTHLGARQVVEQLAAKYKKNRKVDIQVIDNSRGAGKAVVSTIDKLPKLDENQVRKELRDALERARKSGAISERIYRGTADYAK